MEALFSCSKCLKRYPFDELSQGEQLCKECRNNYPTVKCTYCRAEFQQNSKGSTSSLCAKCVQNVKHYGKPTACENCSVLAAFIGNRCQRCVNSEKKWGRPKICEQCKLKCAFDRPERRKADGKLMCWLCDQAYKRVLAKTRKSQEFILKSSKTAPIYSDSPNKTSSPSNHDQVFAPVQTSKSLEGMTVLERLTRMATSGGSSQGNTPPISLDRKLDSLASMKAYVENRMAETAASGTLEDESKEDKHRSHHHRHGKHKQHHHHRDKRSHHSKRRHSNSKDEDDSGDIKKSKSSDKNTPNGVTGAAASTPKSTGSNEASNVDTVTSENVILITQLKEQIESIKKQMIVKDQQLMEKDKKINELKAEMFENDKNARSKNQTLQRSHNNQIETLQTKVRELTRQVATLSKDKGKDKKSSSSAAANSDSSSTQAS